MINSKMEKIEQIESFNKKFISTNIDHQQQQPSQQQQQQQQQMQLSQQKSIVLPMLSLGGVSANNASTIRRSISILQQNENRVNSKQSISTVHLNPNGMNEMADDNSINTYFNLNNLPITKALAEENNNSSLINLNLSNTLDTQAKIRYTNNNSNASRILPKMVN